jgi:8-oxo-dGTP diphosphatase
MAHKLFQVGVKALVTNSEGKILLLKATEGFHDAHWDLPGGRIEDTQTPEEALCREIAEEIGVAEVSDIKFHSGCISNFELNFDDLGTVGLVLMAYEVKIPESAAIVLSDEHTDYEWVERADLPARLKVKYPEEFTNGLLAR